MPNDLPTNLAGNVATEEEQQAQENQQFWNNVYSKFNPQAPVANTPSSFGSFQTAAGNTQNQLKQQLGAVGPTGSLDVGNLQKGIQNNANQLTRSTDLNSYLQDMEKNRQESNKYGVGGMGREMSLFGANEAMNKLPQERELSQAETQDQINQKWNDYYHGQTPWENLFGGAVGGGLGKLAGQKLFGGGNNNGAMSSLYGIENQVDNLQQP